MVFAANKKTGQTHFYLHHFLREQSSFTYCFHSGIKSTAADAEFVDFINSRSSGNIKGPPPTTIFDPMTVKHESEFLHRGSSQDWYRLRMVNLSKWLINRNHFSDEGICVEWGI